MTRTRLAPVPRTSPPETPALDAVRKASTKYRRAQAARDSALEELLEACREASAAGDGPYNIIRASGLAKQTVYDAIRSQPAPARTDEEASDA